MVRHGQHGVRVGNLLKRAVKYLLELLLRAQAGGVTALLLTAVRGTLVEAGIAPADERRGTVKTGQTPPS